MNAGKVMLAFPYGDIEPRFMRSVVFLLKWDHDHHDRIFDGGAYLQFGTSNVAHGRNEIVRTFLGTDCEWLWFVDTDMDFPPDTLDRLVAAADPVERPIMGGLCFALMRGDAQEVVPTLYTFTDDGLPARVTRVPKPDGVGRYAATGAGCLLIHRSVLEGLERFTPRGSEVPFGERSFPWFEWSAWQTADKADVMGEDLTFCFRAAAAGYPTHVDTSIKVGHVKPVVIDEATYDAQWGTQPGLFAVIPMKDKYQLTSALVAQLRDQGGYQRIFVMDNGSVGKPSRNWLSSVDGKDGVTVVPMPDVGIHAMWNEGVRRCLELDPHARVAILNNDLIIGPDFLAGLSAGFVDDRVLAVCPNYDLRPGEGVVDVEGISAGREDGTGGLSGFAFMVRAEMFPAGFPAFDESLEWFFGDNDFTANVARYGGRMVMVLGTTVEHLGSQTTGGPCGVGPLAEAYARDESTFLAKWGGRKVEGWESDLLACN